MPFVGLLVAACIGTASQDERLLQQVQAISATQKQASVLVRVGSRTRRADARRRCLERAEESIGW